MDVTQLLLEKVLPAVGAGATSALLAVGKWIKGVSDRTGDLEKKFDLLPHRLDAVEVSLRSLHEECRRLRGEIQQLSDQTDGKASKVSFSKVAERVTVLESKLHTTELQVGDLSASLDGFIREQNEQWNSINRSLGEISGYLKGQRVATTADSGQFPGRPMSQTPKK